MFLLLPVNDDSFFGKIPAADHTFELRQELRDAWVRAAALLHLAGSFSRLAVGWLDLDFRRVDVLA